MPQHIVTLPATLSPLSDISSIVKKALAASSTISLKNSWAIHEIIALNRMNNKIIQKIYKNLAKRSVLDRNPERQWLVENERIIMDTTLSLGRNLNANLLSRLPIFSHAKNTFRITWLLNLLLSHSNFSLNQSRLESFIQTYQREENLTIAELWSISALCQGVIVDGLAQIMKSIIAEPTASPQNKVREKLISHMVGSLRFLQAINWKGFIEKLSLVDKILRKDPAGLYPKMDFATRDTYRHEIEEIYYASISSQEEIATWVLTQAKKFSKTDYQHHIGYFLAGNGKKELEHAFKKRVKTAKKIFDVFVTHITKTYIFSQLLLTFAFELLLFFIFPGHPIFLLVLAAPALFLSHLVVNTLMIRIFKPVALPKMDWELPVEIKNRTMVVVPTLLSDRAGEIDHFLTILETTYLSNTDPNIFFALLLAFPEKSGTSGQFTDSEKTRFYELKVKLATLNKKYPRGVSTFHLFFRERVWSPAQQLWIEWERKRGKIMEFNELLRGQEKTSFIYKSADATFLKTVKYVVTMDQDINLPRGTAKKLIATIAHPLNQAVLDPTGPRIIDGYGIIQPRFSSLKHDHLNPLAVNFFSSRTGWDSYSGIVSDVYQDIFHEGIFQGNGIYDVDVFYTILHHRFPTNLLLSHDHIEGFYCRTGFASDIQIFEDFPANYWAFRTRLERWTRGDWQRLVWSLASVIPDQFGIPKVNPLAIAHRWKLTSDLIFSCVPGALVLTLFLGLVTNTILQATILTVLLAIFPVALSLVDDIFAKKNWHAWRYSLRLLGANLTSTLLRIGFNLAFLPDQAVALLSSQTLAVYRVYIARKNQLSWVVSHHISQKTQSGLATSFYRTRIATTLSFSLVILILLTRPANFVFPLLLTIGWTCAPLLAWVSSQAPRQKPHPFNQDETKNLLLIASSTWNFFAKLVNSSTNFLPPDHFQTATLTPVSTRTSITDIGMYLLSIVASFDLGLISQTVMVTSLEATLKTLQKLDRYQGHFFNWYSIIDLHALPPSYISTVDSGNFAACLMVVSQTLKNLRHDRLAKIADTLVAQMNFNFLYNSSRDLFHIGYNFSQKRFDKNHYDLLASETRLTSFIAIAHNQIPLRHWLSLGRPTTAIDGRLALLSWGGSLFEYLFPLMVMPNVKNSLLSVGYDTAVKLQIGYGRKNSIPWGMSESSYGLKNKDGHYRYKLHGIPTLSLRQTPYQELVISPYSTFLALEINPKRAYHNIKRLQKLAVCGQYGFYEAIDFTTYGPGASPDKLVETYLCHHQGSILVAIANLLKTNAIKNRFAQDPKVKSALLLLEEELPQYPSLVTPLPPPKNDAVMFFAQETHEPVELVKEHYETPMFHILSNSQYHTVVDNRGFGHSSFGQTRLIDNRFIFIADPDLAQTWGATYAPRFTKPDHYESIYHLNGFRTIRQNFDIETQLDIAISPTDNVEIRRLTLYNLGTKTRALSIFGFGQLSGGDYEGDQSHPTFSKMRMAIDQDPASSCLLFSPKRPLGQGTTIAYKFLTANDCAYSYATNRIQFVTRGQITHFIPDPILGFETKLTLPALQKTTLHDILAVGQNSQEAVTTATKFTDLARLTDTFAGSVTIAPDHLDESPDPKLCQQLLSLLMEKTPLPKIIADKVNLPEKQPTVAVQIFQDSPKGFLTHVLRATFFLAQRGLHLNLIILTHDGDNYFSHVTRFAQDLTSEFENLSANFHLLSPRIAIVSASLLDHHEIADILKYATVSLDAKDKSLSDQLDKLSKSL